MTVTQHTPKGKDQDLLQMPDASEAQKLKGPTQIQRQTRHNYSQLTENEKLSFKLHLLSMMRETLLSAILSRKYQMTLST